MENKEKKISKNDKEPKKVRRQIISLVQRFQELSKGMTLLPSVSCKLRSVVTSKTLKTIRKQTGLICGKWGKDYDDVETMLKEAERLRKAYVNLIFRSKLIHDINHRQKLDEIPLALGEIISKIETQQK